MVFQGLTGRFTGSIADIGIVEPTLIEKSLELAQGLPSLASDTDFVCHKDFLAVRFFRVPRLRVQAWA